MNLTFLQIGHFFYKKTILKDIAAKMDLAVGLLVYCL
jgi:hypothetical protein